MAKILEDNSVRVNLNIFSMKDDNVVNKSSERELSVRQ